MNERDKRLNSLMKTAVRNLVTPEEYAQRIIRSAIQDENPFIKKGDPYVVLGHDGFDGSWFPAGSFQSIDETIDCVRKKTEEEPLYSDGEEISTTFHPFTTDGVHLGHFIEELGL